LDLQPDYPTYTCNLSPHIRNEVRRVRVKYKDRVLTRRASLSRLVINEMPTAGSAILTNTDGASPPAYIVGVRGDESTIYDGRDGRLLCEIDWVNDCIYVDEKSVPVSDFLQPSPGGR
jgi:hypothetical protein